MAASLTVSDKHITPAHCSVRGSSDSGASVFKDVMGMSTEGFPEAHPVLEVFNVSARHDPHTVQSTVGPEAKVSQESVRLFHSKPTLNLMDERSSRASPSKDSVLQASDSVTFQSKLPDTIVEVKRDSLDHLSQQSLSIIPHSNPLNWESPGHIAVMIDSNEPLNDANNRASTLSDAKTTSSLSRTSHSSTDYYTAHESLDFSSESSMGGGAHLSLDSASDHRDSLQPTMEPVDAKGNNLLKTSSSASLFIPRGFSNVRQENTLRGSRHQRGSTSTLYSILAQLSEASGDDDHEAGDPQTAHRVYEPY